MRLRYAHAKGLLLITCLIMVLCLIQRTVVLRDVLTVAASQSQSVSSAPQADKLQQDLSSGLKPCQFSAHSLLCAQPPFFDGAIPALLLFLLLVTLFTEIRCERFCDRPVPIPRLRIHLHNCVFHE